MQWFMDRLVWVVSALAMIAVLMGCGKAAEKMQEAAIEKAIEAGAAKDGKKVDVDLSGGNVSVTTDEGQYKSDAQSGAMTFTSADGAQTVAVGAGATIPKDFPADVPVYPDTEVLAASADANEGSFALTLRSKDAIDKIVEHIKSEAGAKGWTEDSTVTQGDPDPMHMIIYSKDDRNVMYMVAKDQDGIGITITVSKK